MALRLRNKLTHAVRYWLLRRLPPCQQMARVMSESLDRPLSWRERVALKLHLWVCVWCVRFLEQLHGVRGALRARAAQAPTDGPRDEAVLSAEARERIVNALNRSNR
jgi:hypothetical protein